MEGSRFMVKYIIDINYKDNDLFYSKMCCSTF